MPIPPSAPWALQQVTRNGGADPEVAEVALTLSSSFTRILTTTELLLGFWSIFLCRVHRSIPAKNPTKAKEEVSWPSRAATGEGQHFTEESGDLGTVAAKTTHWDATHLYQS